MSNSELELLRERNKKLEEENLSLRKQLKQITEQSEYDKWWHKVGDASYATLGEIEKILKLIETESNHQMTEIYGLKALNKINAFMLQVCNENPRRKPSEKNKDN